MSDLKELGFMDDAHIELLEEMGVRTVEEFMAQAADGTSRSELAEITEIPEKMILRWAHLCEILDISEIPKGLVHILEEAGVKEVRDFRNQNAKHLHDKLVVRGKDWPRGYTVGQEAQAAVAMALSRMNSKPSAKKNPKGAQEKASSTGV